MCVICIKYKGADFPPLEEIKNCIHSNPDGFAIAWNQNGRLMVRKTLSPEELVAIYRTVSLCDPAKTAMVLHARIKTHGQARLENCHLWEGGGLAFAHNGIMSAERLAPVRIEADRTDSEAFFRGWFLPLWEAAGRKFTPYVRQLCEHFCRCGYSSKFAFIDAAGNVTAIGDYIAAENRGLKGTRYYSNGSFRSWGSMYGGSSAGNPVSTVRSAGAPAAGAYGSAVRMPETGKRKRGRPRKDAGAQTTGPAPGVCVQGELPFGDRYRAARLRKPSAPELGAEPYAGRGAAPAEDSVITGLGGSWVDPHTGNLVTAAELDGIF